jgi:superfamily II DNA or RNA helicase
MSSSLRLSRADIREYVGNSYFERGRSYFEQGRVAGIEVIASDAQRLRLQGEVRGSGGRLYRQQIEIEWARYGPSIDGECSCPVGYNCKHVAAVCLAWKASPEPAADSDDGAGFAKSWLSRVAAAGSEPAEPADERLLYILKPGERGVAVELRIARPLKSGSGLSKGRIMPLGNLSVGYRTPAYLQPADEEIIELLQSLAGRSWPMVPVLLGPIGQPVLERMVATGRCFWQQHGDGPLRPGDPRRLIVHWREHADATIALDLATDPPARVLLTDPPFYLDERQHRVGPLQTSGLKTSQLVELLAAPRLRRSQAEAVSRLLLREFPGLPLPTPTAVAMTEITDVPPRPQLTLTGDDASGAHQLRLSFDYGGYQVPAQPSEASAVVDTADGLARVSRDTGAERAAIDALMSAGFEPVDDNRRRGPLRLVPAGASLIERASRWSELIRETLPALEAQGWQIETEPSFMLRFDSADFDASIDDDDADMERGNDWFGLRFDLELDGRRLPLLPIIAPLLEQGLDRELPPMVSVPLPPDGSGDGLQRFVDLPAERLRPILDTLRELFTYVPPERDGSLKLTRFDAPALDELAGRGIALRGGERLRDLAQRLRALDRIAPVEPPAGLSVELRTYQRRGLDWLQFLRDFHLGGVLADDMGLGKTVQTLAHVLLEKEAGRLDQPALVIAPTSLISNWRREAARFAPDLRVLVLHGGERHGEFARIAEHDLVVTTYPLLPRDREALAAQRWHLLILDEAQTIKNPRAQAAQVARSLDARHRLCLTGTPMENHLGELWALFDFLMPGFLGDSQRFKRHWRTPIEQHGDAEQRERLARRVAPFLLRRRKQDVLTELPPKTEIVRSVALEDDQAALYEGIRLSMEKRVRSAISAQGLARSQITILDALLKLRQACCDPRLLKLPAAARVTGSAKLSLLMDLLPEQLEEGRRILLFSQFTSMLALIEAELDARGIEYTKLTGRTRKRDEAIERFRGGDVDLFLISLKAGGLGLNLVEADTVILYDPWWNPAVESQAADRAHRIGQDKPVFVYKLLTEQTVEERMLAMQQQKRALADSIYRGGGADGGPAFNAEDIAELFAPIAA